MPEDNCPILVGCGQAIQREVSDLAEAKGPIDLMLEAAVEAERDTGAKILARADRVHVVRFLSGTYDDPARLLAARIGSSAKDVDVTKTGGNSPQRLINETAEILANGGCSLAVLAGAETLGSFLGAMQRGIMPKWLERDGAQANVSNVDFERTAEHETPYELQRPINVYPLFENALRAHYGRGVDAHRRALGELFAPFSAIAAENPYAWFREKRTAAQISEVGPDNRYIGFPYTKYMNAIIRVDQAAAVVMTTVKTARELGINESRWVYLHGCADVQDHWFVSERPELYRSPAIRIAAREAFGMAGWDVADVDYFDLYSCFPSAVQIARDEIGIAENDPRPLTVTGGLPYHGGPANNYVMHSVATMMNHLRENPGKKGVCTAVGWFITKNSIGLYSTDPVEGSWSRKNPSIYQAEMDALPKVTIAVEASGQASVESYTVLFGKESAEKAIVVGRLKDNRRFLATTENTPEILDEMTRVECVGRVGTVEHINGRNVFRFS